MSLFEHLDDDASSADHPADSSDERAGTSAGPLDAGPTDRVAMTLAYDGTGFRGFAHQRDQRTVAGVLAAAVERVAGVPVEITCAGRTDAGVHARAQVVTFDLPVDGVTPERLVSGVNGLCAPEIVVRSARLVADGFDARRSALWRRYRYSVLNAPAPDPFLAATTWWVAEPLDVRSMTLACDPFIGEHDFSSFCRRPKVPAGVEPPSLVRRVIDLRWERAPDEVLHLWIEASSFCHQMVRSVVGTLVEVGRGKRRAGEMAGVIRARDRHAAGQMAPAQGLCLWEVGYPDDP
ncbi:MAG: tRNA pseudouridine(38-40) synthase TruA [Acidimicrobiia bacterium]|nr:tRNA pseudouridine(38-40) synthase TruA [Acidimicrobiia bacterium]